MAQYEYNTSGIRTIKRIYVDHPNFKFSDKSNTQTEANNSNSFYTTKFFLNGNKIIKQIDCCNTFTFYYGIDGITGFHLTNTKVDADYYYKKNAQNDIIGIYDSTGNQICEYIYDAWGNQKIKYLSNNGEYVAISDFPIYNDIEDINKFIAFKNPFRYRSYYYDFETNLYYLNSRYYDPQTGRFINADDVSVLDNTNEMINGLNLFIYCNDNPINYIDNTGNSLIALFLILMATTITGATIKGVNSYNEGKRGWDLFKDIVLGASLGLATGGALIAIGSVAIGAMFSLGATIFGVPVMQSFAIGALAFNFTAYFIGPLFGIEMQGIEVDTPNNNEQQFKYQYKDTYTSYEINKNLIKVYKRNNSYDRIQWDIIKKLQKIYY